jgi:hypothetical protein
MPHTATPLPTRVRPFRRPSPPIPDLCVRTVRPSFLDLRFSDDAWVLDRGEELLALCLGSCRLAGIRGLPLDLPSLNQLLDRARHTRPRWYVRRRN